MKLSSKFLFNKRNISSSAVLLLLSTPSSLLVSAEDGGDVIFPPEGNEWIPPGDGDVRSPCPFINALANHGYINRSGKDVDLFDMVEKLATNFDVTEDLFQILASGAIDLNFTTTDDNGTIRMDIDQLFNPGQEHDASFVRADKYFGFEESKLVDLDLLEDFLATGNDTDVLTKNDVMLYQYSRILDSRMNNPEHFFAEGQATSFSAQATLILNLGQDPMLETVGKDLLREFFTFERFPNGYMPLIMNSSEAVNVIGAGTLANDVRLEFAESFMDAISVDLESDTDEPMADDTAADDTMEGDTMAPTSGAMATDEPTEAPSGASKGTVMVGLVSAVTGFISLVIYV